MEVILIAVVISGCFALLMVACAFVAIVCATARLPKGEDDESF